MKLKKVIAVCLVALLALLAFGCTKTEPNAAPTPGAPTPAAPAEPTPAPEEKYSVAMIINGTINDKGWNETAYNGLIRAGEELGVETAYSENVQQADFETTMRDYASQGYDMIICVGNQFSDAALVVAPSFPDVAFSVMNGNDFQEPNLAAYRFNTPETGFMAGVLAALYSESGVVGMIGGTTLPHIKDGVDAFALGAKYINPDITALTGWTESMDDVALGKEMGMAFIEQGADVLCANANSCALGVIDAAATSGKRHIGYPSDQYDVAPHAVMVSMVQSNEFLILAMVRAGVEGEFAPSLHLFGMKEGAIFVSDFHGHDAKLSAEDLAKIEEVKAGIIDGSLKAQGILPKSIFEVE